ncbi:MAG: hypothetical protein GF349_03615 [Candidatus Magasanikbacteria bacterium]|nr:hypothetical protein [Candidatus Magasanikbacteria bacterium]
MPKKKNKKQKQYKKAYVVTVDMGYGHQRAVYPLKDIAACPEGWDGCGIDTHNIITANNYPGIPGYDKRRWEGGRSIYEKISRMKKIPLIGKIFFGVMDHLQRIEPFYPKRDLSRPTFQVRSIYRMIEKGWGKHLIEVLNRKPLPMITSFFSTAFFAEYHNFKEDIYCICTDTDISRAWVGMEPAKSRIKYLAPNRRVKERLMLYGVKEKNIYITGFPLPKENIGGKDLHILKKSIAYRIANLDPENRYRDKYQRTLKYYLGRDYCNKKPRHPLTITFAVGGAGAQRQIGSTILESLHSLIRKKQVHLNLVAGVRNDVYKYYYNYARMMGIDKSLGTSLNIIYDTNKIDYFKKFNQILLTTDILWTKPSELSFYAGLGLPIIMAPPIGSQEDYNKDWLHAVGAGFEQDDPRYTHEWLFDWLSSGWLAQAAMEGFLDAPRNGAYHTEEIVLEGKRSEIEDMHLL